MLGLQKVLSRLGTFRFDIAEGERSGEATPRVIQAIQRFQEQNGLKVDGLINPAGETIKALRKRVDEAPAKSGRPPPRPPDRPDEPEEPEEPDKDKKCQQLAVKIENLRLNIADQEELIAFMEADIKRLEERLRELAGEIGLGVAGTVASAAGSLLGKGPIGPAKAAGDLVVGFGTAAEKILNDPTRLENEIANANIQLEKDRRRLDQLQRELEALLERQEKECKKRQP